MKTALFLGMAATFALAWSQPLMAAPGARAKSTEIRTELDKARMDGRLKEMLSTTSTAKVRKTLEMQILGGISETTAKLSTRANKNEIQKFAAGSEIQAETVSQLAKTDAMLADLRTKLAETTEAAKKSELELEITSLEAARPVITEFIAALGMFGKVEMMKGEDASANAALDTLIQILPSVVSKYKVVKDNGKLVHERDGYVKMMAKATESIIRGTKPADAIKQSLNNAQQLNDLANCKKG